MVVNQIMWVDSSPDIDLLTTISFRFPAVMLAVLALFTGHLKKKSQLNKQTKNHQKASYKLFSQANNFSS